MLLDATPVLTPIEFGGFISNAPVLDRKVELPSSMLVRRWRDFTPHIEQPSLDAHCICMHLGGSKRIHRSGADGQETAEVDPGAFTIVPAGSASNWRVEGPTEFAHVYLDREAISRMIASTFETDPRNVSIRAVLGARDPLTEGLVHAILDGPDGDDPTERRYLEELQHLLVHQLLRRYSTLADRDKRARYSLAPHRLKRVLEFMECHLGADIGLSEIASSIGLSPFHFSRAFRREMGVSPYAYLLRRRMAFARTLLMDPKLPLPVVARRCGFNSHGQFTRSFKRDVGVTPNGFRSLQ